ncbi:hypothetical protein DLM77_05170 [Leptospira yasudae]|uniref:Uncharacterized protein n=1 Tax=Leptospira yasudae TaxID=2202201 RepID=A0ABX9M7K0_9LEPT|nr:hypothetical protein DLM77_05170 [Leptospira yasudae]
MSFCLYFSQINFLFRQESFRFRWKRNFFLSLPLQTILAFLITQQKVSELLLIFYFFRIIIRNFLKKIYELGSFEFFVWNSK